MLSYHRLKDNFRAFRTFTSLDRSEFETLLPSFEVAWNAYVYDNHITKKKRQRRFGGGRKARLASIEDKLSAIPAEPPSPMITVSAALAFRKQRCENTP